MSPNKKRKIEVTQHLNENKINENMQNNNKMINNNNNASNKNENKSNQYTNNNNAQNTKIHQPLNNSNDDSDSSSKDETPAMYPLPCKQKNRWGKICQVLNEEIISIERLIKILQVFANSQKSNNSVQGIKIQKQKIIFFFFFFLHLNTENRNSKKNKNKPAKTKKNGLCFYGY